MEASDDAARGAQLLKGSGIVPVRAVRLDVVLEHVHGAVVGGVPRFDVVVGEAHEVLPLELEVQLGKAGPGGGGDQRVVDAELPPPPSDSAWD